ncbi:predicted protein [Histoplasma capsulatum var. duboisii H88]|uniref:Predicted protein n=1 Tax=Ajellomyces capsulatus (strain H88) TaxID=544711 RepID=F0UAZ0_AJEC8|nr:predicted protein [Histoplasma capsulatum var. duboisii H88]
MALRFPWKITENTGALPANPSGSCSLSHKSRRLKPGESDCHGKDLIQGWKWFSKWTGVSITFDSLNSGLSGLARSERLPYSPIFRTPDLSWSLKFCLTPPICGCFITSLLPAVRRPWDSGPKLGTSEYAMHTWWHEGGQVGNEFANSCNWRFIPAKKISLEFLRWAAQLGSGEITQLSFIKRNTQSNKEASYIRAFLSR